MDPVRKIVHPRIAGPVDLQLILNPTVNVKVKLQLIQKISDALEDCCRIQHYFDNMIFVLLKLLSITDPAFSPDNDIFKLRKLVLQILHKISSSNDKMKNHIQNTMGACLKVIETDNEQCVIYCILIFKELLTAFKPKYDGCFSAEVSKFLKLVMDMYNNSNSQEKIFNFQKTNDLKVLISTIRLTTTISKNSINYVFIPMGKVSFKVLKELANILKLYYILFYNVQSFKDEITAFFPNLMIFFNLDIPYKPDYRDLVLDLKHAQVRLLFFFSIFLKDNKEAIRLHCSTLPGRVISLLSCNMSSDVSVLRTELLTGFESLILIDYKCEFLPFMDKFLDETLITGRSWSLKNVLRPKAFIYIDHLITHMHSQLSLNFLVRVIHSHFSNILDPTLQPEVQINLCNMVMNVLSYIVQRQNQSISNINTIEKNNNPTKDLFYRVFQIFVIKLKQFQKFYLPQLDENSISQEDKKESISSILEDNKSKVKKNEFVYGYQSSQIVPYTVADCKRFIKIVIPAIRTLFQFIVKIEGAKFSIEYYNQKSFNNFIKHSLLSLKVYSCPTLKKEMVKEILNAMSCINSTHLKTLMSDKNVIKQIYDNNLEVLVFDMALNDDNLVSIFGYLMFEFILNNLNNKNEEQCIFDLVNRLQLHFKLNTNEEITNNYIYQIIKMLTNNLQHSKHPIFDLKVLKTIIIVVESAKYELSKNMRSVLKNLFCDLLLYHQYLPKSLVFTKLALAELCLAECLFKVVPHCQVMNLLPLVVYSLYESELTSQGLGILEKCLDYLPANFYNDPLLEIRSNVINGLCHCLNSPIESISQSAIRLIGKFGGLNRSSIIKPIDLTAHKLNLQVSQKPQIFITFTDYSNEFIELDIAPSVNTAVETLISNSDRFNKAHSWNIIKGFLLVSMDCDIYGVTTLVSNINWVEFVDLFSNYDLQYTKTITDETYIKALTGLMICCGDEHLKKDAHSYLKEFTKVIVHVALSHFSGVSYGHCLEVNPFVLIDAIIATLSNEKESVSNVGELATVMVMEELHTILKDSMVHFPFIKYMFSQFCKLCYDTNWICKRGGCSGLQILFANILTEDALTKEFSDWLIQHFLTAFKAMLFIFSDFDKHLTFGAIKIAQSNLDIMLTWLYWVKPINLSHDFVQDTILKDLISCIFGPNDLLREQSIKMIDLMANKQHSTVSKMLKPYYKVIRSFIPGKRLFSTYTFKSQVGIMKGHIFCTLYSIPAKKLDLTKRKHRSYFNFLCTLCGQNFEQTKTIKKFKYLTSHQLLQLRLTAMQVLVYCLRILVEPLKTKVFKILLSTLMHSCQEQQNTVYEGLQSCNTKLSIIQIKIVDKLLFYFADLFQDLTKVTIVNTSFVLYLSKLFPSRPNLKFCAMLMNVLKLLWNKLHCCKSKKSKEEIENHLKNVLKTICVIKRTKFSHIKKMCNIFINEDILNIHLCNNFYPLLSECVLKFPEDSLGLFLQEKNIQNPVWSSFFNFVICYEKSESFRNVLTSDTSRLETLLTLTNTDQSKTILYETIKIIYNLMKMDEKWITTSNKLISVLLNIWSNSQYKERYKNLSIIKSTEWDEPKMLLKVILVYFQTNVNEICILFQMLPVFSYRFPLDTNFFRQFLENEVIKSFPVEWKRMVFFKFIELYQKKGVNSDILGKILQYLILPCFSNCYKKGEKEQLLCTFTKTEDNLIIVILNKIFPTLRVALSGCDFDGIKVSLCQLMCLIIDDLLSFKDNICDVIYNAIISCTWIRCTMDINVKFHCYLILTYIMLSGNTSKREKLNQGIYYELLKASYAEAQTVINYSLNLIISSVCVKENEISNDINTVVVCIRKIMMTESQNVQTLHHICSFLIKYHTLFYPYKQFLIRNILGSLFPIAKNNNVPEFKKTAIELSCMIISWELNDDEETMKLKFPMKRKTVDTTSTILPPKKKSSETIDNCLNFLAMVGCQTHDDKQESRISKLAMRSATLFKNILTTEAINTMEVKLKFGWIEKLLDTFLKKENIIKQNPNAHGNTTASVMNLMTTFDIMSFMLNVLSQKLMLEAIKPLQDHIMKFLQLAFNEAQTLNLSIYQKETVSNNRLTILQVKQYNEGTLKLISEILKTFPSNEGLEKLHLYIQMIISEGLSSNCSHKLEISLTLLRVSLIHFPNYMDNEVLNTMGDIMFKFNKNNKNPMIKIKCLEILKTHVDTLTRQGKQVFIEKVVMENLDKARDVENKIPFEVQTKCFELVITYIQDLSEATEGVLLNSTLLQYIKTTTDEHIMTIILNVITKWVEICRDEAVFFNSQIINILKSITSLNRFPKLAEYCYRLNLEIYKNWNSYECIEFGLNCKFPAIRYDFLDFHDTLWRGESGLYSRLYMIISDELSYDLEFSLAFYVRILFVNICKNTKLQGDFTLIDTKQIFDEFGSLTESEKCTPVRSMLTFDMCSSIVQLCFVDLNLAKTIWISILPGIWSSFNDNQKNLLSEKAIHFLTNSKLKNVFMTAFYESVILCKPKIHFKPHQMMYIGKTYNLWYKVIEQLEDISNHFEHEKKNEAIEEMIQMYSLLREEDVLETLFQNTIKCEDTKKAFALEQQGCFRKASLLYIKLFNSEQPYSKVNLTKSYNKDHKFKKIRLTKCLRELNEWDILSEHILKEDNFMLNIENTWKKSIESYSCHNLKWCLEHKQKIWPSKLKWKYHFYLGMFNLNKLDQKMMSSVQEHIQLGTKEILNNWKILPKYTCNAHIPLLQASQLIIELQEVYNVQNSWLETPQNCYNINSLIEIWNNRKPWVGDNLNVWNDLISWRQTYYSFVVSQDTNLEVDLPDIKSAQDNLKLLYGEIALKQNMVEVCMKSLKSIDPNNVTLCNLLHKTYLEAKCMYKVQDYNTNFNCVAHLPMNKDFTEYINPLLLSIRKSFQVDSDHIDVALQYISMAFLNNESTNHISNKWQHVIENNFNSLSLNIKKYNTNINQQPLDNLIKVLNRSKILENAWLQWAKLIQNDFNCSSIKDISVGLTAMKCYVIASKFTNDFKCNIIVANMLWFLNYDDDTCILLRTLEKCNVRFFDLWIPQLLNILVEKNESVIKRVVSKIGSLCPQKIYLTLNRMYLTENLNKPSDKEPENDGINGVQKLATTKNRRINKIKLMMKYLPKQKSSIIRQLGYFAKQMTFLGESWDEELRRNLYECLYQCYDYAFENKNLNVLISFKIVNCIQTLIETFVTEDVNTNKFEIKKTFLVPDNLSQYYVFLKHKCLMDFNFTTFPTVKLVINKLKKWIAYIENKSNYPSKFVHEFRCPNIHNIDWSVIKLPCYSNSFSNAVKIYNFNGYIHLINKSGTVIKQLTIRGTDGLLYTYNISSGHDIEPEERILQLFRLANNYLFDFKETARRHLRLSIPNSFIIAPNMRMVETNNEIFSLFEIYKESISSEWIHEDIDYWFSVLNTSVIIERTEPLNESLIATAKNYGTSEVLKNWATLRYPEVSDFWTFRKTFIEHYSVLSFFEYAFNLIKVKPEMLNIDQNGVAVVLPYKFSLNEVDGNLNQCHSVPFRMTQSLLTFITPYRKHQMINCLTATGHCLNNSMDDMNVVLKLLLKDEFKANFSTSIENTLSCKQGVIEMVDKNLSFIMKNFDELKTYSTHNVIPGLLSDAFHEDLLCHLTPTWRPWL